MALTFQGQAKFEEADEANHAARVKAQGTDSKGRGGANANVNFSLAPADAGSTVLIHTDLQLLGSVAQYGRGVGMIQDLASHLIGQFADNLRGQLEQSGSGASPETAQPEAGTAPGGDAPPAPPPQPAAKPISGISLGLRVLWNAIVRLFKRPSSQT